MKKEILCTLGPTSMNERVIVRLEELGVALFRINLSHTKIRDLSAAIECIQKYARRVPICLDTEGAQVRTGDIVSREVKVHENSMVRVHKQRVPGDSFNLNFYPADIVGQLKPGDFISIDFHSVLAQVVDVDSEGATLRIINDGRVGGNKAVTIDRNIELPTLTDKDREALVIGRRYGIRHAALSFASRAADVDLIRSLAAPGTRIISKIESRSGLLHLDEIAERSDALLIDRGDLSREEPIERIPRLQKHIIARAKAAGKPVYVATNLLESMIVSNRPTRAEVNDVINTLTDGASGLVLAAETAIGVDPIGCATMIVKLIHEFERDQRLGEAYYPEDAMSLLVEPHGGRLVHREATIEDAELSKLRSVRVAPAALTDCQQIALGTYSPIESFMDEETLNSVLDRHRLPDGTAWPMPILLQIDPKTWSGLAKGERIALADADGVAHALLDVSGTFQVDTASTARRWFGTDSPAHPGVKQFLAGGPCLVAGKVTLIRRIQTPFTRYELTPQQSRFVFTHKGWSRVIGFHTRNVIHRAHEHIQLRALDQCHADGLYINPAVGPGQSGDFLPEAVMKSYQAMMDFGLYPPNRVVIGCFSTYPRFSGPREAVFTALCRQNMGCSHFIVGRNHAGVGDYYRDEAYKALFDSLPEIKVIPVFFDAIGYDTAKQAYACADAKGVTPISGTFIRDAIKNNQPLPDWQMREVIQSLLREDLAAKQPVFYP